MGIAGFLDSNLECVREKSKGIEDGTLPHAILADDGGEWRKGADVLGVPELAERDISEYPVVPNTKAFKQCHDRSLSECGGKLLLPLVPVTDTPALECDWNYSTLNWKQWHSSETSFRPLSVASLIGLLLTERCGLRVGATGDRVILRYCRSSTVQLNKGSEQRKRYERTTLVFSLTLGRSSRAGVRGYAIAGGRRRSSPACS